MSRLDGRPTFYVMIGNEDARCGKRMRRGLNPVHSSFVNNTGSIQVDLSSLNTTRQRYRRSVLEQLGRCESNEDI
jgi:hypothetical protein